MKNNASQEQIEKIITQFQEGDARELHVKIDGFEIFLSRDKDGGISVQQGQLSPGSTVRPTVAKSVSEGTETKSRPSREASENELVVKAPYMGTFYRSPKPGSDPYVEAGQEVTATTELCLVEVMKLFTAVRAGVDGIVKDVLVEDGAMVEVGQALFIIEAKS